MNRAYFSSGCCAFFVSKISSKSSEFNWFHCVIGGSVISQELPAFGPSVGKSICAYIFHIRLSFCWYYFYSEDKLKFVLVSKRCDYDNLTLSPSRPCFVQKTTGSRTVAKVSAADTAHGGSWPVFGGEWQRKSQGCSTRRVMLPSTCQGPACRGAGLSRWVSAIFTAMPFQGEGSTMLGSTCSLGNLHVFESGKYFPTISWSFSYLNGSCDLHWFSLLAVIQERFTCHIATGGWQ